jgi:hypothetical protein
MLPKRDLRSAGPPVRRFPRWILLLRLEACDLERAVVLCPLQAPCNDNSSTGAAAPQPPSFPTPPGVFASRPVQLPCSPDRRDRAERGGISVNISRPVPGAPSLCSHACSEGRFCPLIIPLPQILGRGAATCHTTSSSIRDIELMNETLACTIQIQRPRPQVRPPVPVSSAYCLGY